MFSEICFLISMLLKSRVYKVIQLTKLIFFNLIEALNKQNLNSYNPCRSKSTADAIFLTDDSISSAEVNLPMLKRMDA